MRFGLHREIRFRTGGKRRSWSKMSDKRQLEFFLLRYVPDAVKDEFVNIGVVMTEPAANGSGFADVDDVYHDFVPDS